MTGTSSSRWFQGWQNRRVTDEIRRGRQYENGPLEPGPRWHNVFPRTNAWRYQDWGVSVGGYRLVIEYGVMIGLAYDEWPYPWGDERYLTSELIFDGEIRRVTGQLHRCSAACACPHHGTPMIYWPRGDDHACQDVNCEYGHGVKKMLLAADVALALDDDLPAVLSITCPRCGMTNYNENDIREGYCGNCHDWTSAR